MLEKVTPDMVSDLYNTICLLESSEDAKNFFADLSSKNEILQMAQRLRAAELLMDGKTYAEVTKETGISSATLSRVSACVRHGKGGYLKYIALREGKGQRGG
jgi:TrpR-related protein YerC/YecD